MNIWSIGWCQRIVSFHTYMSRRNSSAVWWHRSDRYSERLEHMWMHTWHRPAWSVSTYTQNCPPATILLCAKWCRSERGAGQRINLGCRNKKNRLLKRQTPFASSQRRQFFGRCCRGRAWFGNQSFGKINIIRRGREKKKTRKYRLPMPQNDIMLIRWSRTCIKWPWGMRMAPLYMRYMSSYIRINKTALGDIVANSPTQKASGAGRSGRLDGHPGGENRYRRAAAKLYSDRKHFWFAMHAQICGNVAVSVTKPHTHTHKTSRHTKYRDRRPVEINAYLLKLTVWWKNSYEISCFYYRIMLTIRTNFPAR